jgi:hypothetical protein
MPETDINTNTNVELEADTGATSEGPDEDDPETMYDPGEIEASRARELGLGVGARDLERQRDPDGGGAPSREGGVERLNRDELTASDAIVDSDANDLSIDETFDDPDEGPERHDDRVTGGPI